MSSTTVIRYYYDDIVVASNDPEEHSKVIHASFNQLDVHGLTVSEAKLQLGQTNIHFLGYNISQDRIAIDNSKIETIQKWKMPDDRKGLIKFIGFVNYLRNFIPNASSLLAPFYEVTNTDKSTVKQQFSKNYRINRSKLSSTLLSNFQKIKQLITDSLKLKLFDPQVPTFIYTDANQTGGASMVCQPKTINGKVYLYPIAFYSIRFTPTQQRYSTVERELFAVLHTLEKARLILSPQITIFTDNTGIVSIGRSERNTHPRFTKYLDILNGYRLTWKHIPGPTNVVADYLSRFGLSNQPYLQLSDIDKVATEIELEDIHLKAVNTEHNIPSNTQPPDRLSESTPTNTESNEANEPSPNTEQSNEVTDPTPSTIPNDTLVQTEDDNIIIDSPINLTWTEILLIKELFTTSGTIPQKFSKVIIYFTLINNILYYFRDNQLYHIINDAEYLDRATTLHQLFHASHRVLQQMMITDHLWPPNGQLLTLDVTKTCRHCEVHQRFVSSHPTFHHQSTSFQPLAPGLCWSVTQR